MMIQKNSKMPQKMMKKGKKCCESMGNLVGGVTQPKEVKKEKKGKSYASKK